MKKPLDFHRLAKAHRAKKAWEQVQEEKSLETADLDLNQRTKRKEAKLQPGRRKSS